MASRKQSTTPQSSPDSHGPAPTASRPLLPPQYGLARDVKGMLAWPDISRRLAEAQHYWICTVTTDNRPHAVPVDGIWLNGCLYFGGSPETRWRRNLAANPAMSVHLENAMEVVILEGRARHQPVDPAVAKILADSSKKKYGYGSKPQEYEERGALVFRPRVAFAWSNLPKDATRFEFAADEPERGH